MSSPRHDDDPNVPPDHRELEWQFDAVDLRPVQRWLSSRDPDAMPSVGPGPVREHVDTYWDTEDWRLYRAGYTLRTRETDDGVEATMKTRTTNDAGPRDRREITEALADDRAATLLGAPGPMGDRLRALVGRRSPRRLFEVRTRRRALPVILEGRQVAELALDDTAIPVPPDERPVRLQRVEVEIAHERGEHRSEVRSFVQDLQAACGLSPAAGPKFETGLMATGLGPPPPPDLGPIEVDPSKSVGEVAFAVLRRQFGAFLEHEPGSRLGEDPEEIHDMRVSIRRMRAAIRLFGDALPVRAQSLRRELKWVAGVLGEVRDLDVQLQQVSDWAGEFPEQDRGALGPVVDIVRTRHADARRDLIRALDSRRYQRLVDGMTGMLQRGPLRRSPPSRTPALLAGPDVVRSMRRKMRRRGDAITDGSPPEDLHRLRIRGKRVRYAVEFLEPAYGEPARRLAQRLSEMQDVLGLHQDAQVAMRHLRDLVREHGTELPPQAVFVLGRLAERYRAQAAEQRSRVGRAYARVRGKAWRRLRRAMEERRAEAEAARRGRRAARPPGPSTAPREADSSAVPA
jgi:triphosphatase